MPSYFLLRNQFKELENRKKVIENLVGLRDQPDKNIPEKDVENSRYRINRRQLTKTIRNT